MLAYKLNVVWAALNVSETTNCFKRAYSREFCHSIVMTPIPGILVQSH